MYRSVVEKPLAARRTSLGEPVEHLVEGLAVERIVQEHDEIARWKSMLSSVGAYQANVAAPRRQVVRLREVFSRDLEESRGNLDADDLLEGILGRQQGRAAHTGAYVDEHRGLNFRGREFRQQPPECGNRHGLVMRRVRARIAGGSRVEIVQERDGVSRDAMVAVESPSGRAFRRSHRTR